MLKQVIVAPFTDKITEDPYPRMLLILSIALFFMSLGFHGVAVGGNFDAFPPLATLLYGFVQFFDITTIAAGIAWASNCVLLVTWAHLLMSRYGSAFACRLAALGMALPILIFRNVSAGAAPVTEISGDGLVFGCGSAAWRLLH